MQSMVEMICRKIQTVRNHMTIKCLVIVCSPKEYQGSVRVNFVKLIIFNKEEKCDTIGLSCKN